MEQERDYWTPDDSATNNHQRFVRGQFEEKPVIVYDQNKWTEFSFYQQIDGQQIIDFWTIYNRQLLGIIRHFPKENLLRECKTSNDKIYAISFLFNEYVAHVEHHLRQVVAY